MLNSIAKAGRIAVASRSFSKHPTLRAELLSRYPEVLFNDSGKSLTGPELVEFLKGHQKIITGLEVIDDELLDSLPGLETVSKYGVGTDMIDMTALKKRNIRLGWTAGVNRRSVSELTLAMMICLLRKVVPANRAVLSGKWAQVTGQQLSGKTVGIIGCGNVGEDLATLLKAFGCTLLVHDILDKRDFCKKIDATQADLEVVLSLSDIVSIHVPLTSSTRQLIGKKQLALLKPSAILLNYARGDIVDEAALKEALLNNKLAGAAFDVFAVEPPTDFDLLRLPNFLATPHIGGSAEEAILAMGRAAIEGLEKAEVPNV